MRLTPKGRAQIEAVGVQLADDVAEWRAREGALHFGRVRVLHSSFYRARETAGLLLQALANRFGEAELSTFLDYREDDRLREQMAGFHDYRTRDDFAVAHPEEAAYHQKMRASYADYYMKHSLGDSLDDIGMRLRSLRASIMYDYDKNGIRTFILPTHGAVIKVFCALMMHHPVEWVVAEDTPKNGWARLIEGTHRAGYVDRGYIYGEGAPLRNPAATQKTLQDVGNVYMLAPQRPSAVVPSGIKVRNPYRNEA